MTLDSDNRLLRDWGRYRRRPRGSLPAWAWPVLAISLVAVVGIGIWLSSRSAHWRPPSGVPQFVPCTDGGRVDAWCGRVATPADPRKPHGTTISLHVTVLPATQRPAAGALFYLEGGPGGVASAVRVNELFARVGRTRDLVLVDQRGTGGSGPLACPDRHVRSGNAEAVAAYLRHCLARLAVDARLYTTSAAADDLETVRRTLGYRKIDLYGGSYGATLAQAFVRRYPGSARSVVLDSGSLPGVRIYDVSARNAERALDAVLRRCTATPTCAHAYPDTRRQLGELLARPARLVRLPTGRVLLRPGDIAWTVDWLSETATNAAIVPFAVDAAAHGDYTTLATTYADQLGGRRLDPLARLVPFWAILCSERWAAFDPAATARTGRGSYLVAAAVARARLFSRACRVVPTARVAGERPRAVRVPTLLLAGSADPLDPPANLDGWRRLFPRGRLVVVRGAGHGTIEYSCVQTLVARFVARGTAAGLDAACARRVSMPAFVTG